MGATTKLSQSFYDVENLWTTLLDSDGPVKIAGSSFHLQGDRKFANIESIQSYVNKVIEHTKGEFSHSRPCSVIEKVKMDKSATYHPAKSAISLNTYSTSSNGWAMREAVILHELAHHFSVDQEGAHHDKSFRDNMVKLVRLVMGDQEAFALQVLIWQSF